MKYLITKVWGTIGYVIMVVGLLMTISMAAMANSSSAIVVFLVGVIVTAFLTLIPFTVSVLLDRLEAIDESLNEIADGDLKSFATGSQGKNGGTMGNTETSNISKAVDKWICERCGRVNDIDVSVCRCGWNRDLKKIICAGCGGKNDVNNRFCKKCGGRLEIPPQD